jgi:hypothetical protein
VRSERIDRETVGVLTHDVERLRTDAAGAAKYSEVFHFVFSERAKALLFSV